MQLTTVEKVKDWCKIIDKGTLVEGGATIDDILTNFINRMSFIILRNTGYKDAKDYTTFFDGDETVFQPPAWPINSVSSVQVLTFTIPVADRFGCGYNFDEDLLYIEGYKIPEGRRIVQIQWNCGLQDNTDIVQAFEQIILDWINYIWSKRKHSDQLNEKGGNFVTVSFSDHDVPPFVQTQLDKIRDLVPRAI